MRILAESIKRLYVSEKLTKAQVVERAQKGSISAEEYANITGEAYQDGEGE